MKSRTLFALVIATALHGCASVELPEALANLLASEPERIDRQDQLESVLEGRKAVGREDGDDVLAYARPEPAIKEPTPPLPEVTPDALVGAPSRRVRGWMGAPDAMWREGDHAMWRYQDRQCVILLFVDPSDTVRKVAISRRDGKGPAGCGKAISNRIGDIPAS
ncbi:hypothetical protein [Minwuia sp.]|uniref:hypothetical protein n=1 Tax=Minwuia sp. TaxID=2493630 RepID=UPI003A915A07